MTGYREFSASQEQELNNKNINEFRTNAGKVGGPFEGFPLALITTVGAKTGKERTSPVGLFEINDTKYIIGSAAGRDRNPGWVANIRKNPKIKVEIGANPPTHATVEELSGDYRDEIFTIVKNRAPGFAAYEAATSRVIPVFELNLAQ
ncbi:deazaflavin-dependent nitroreductase family protein [Mycobacteroides abscessus subsp. abscessus]|uniref:nitroreductase family deazaflavin-dependent oxidoreductase n=1 Tax=Mycobacteroides abscessus TaxID=36809 RepID=UPI00092B29D4|nr:nitroreductase family deazaflavin-dependent oxidoreductase [Mycobacteroides abscessus]MDM2350373.1 nitroreductase family deazaflavin-dependent oxidoreductase [Mycobacteroides abscessus]MDM2360946.1 nitroreductase family deazaflavin-dependent oxidoreductase [Mycobacteroides abscessus]QSN53253.1 nitroreductase family deazaflavin-dependent oxidoreductase [Mycobacteroides abscessus subsp. abscessus]SIG93570.1 deazaflavin-dependent nitroreductase family protein [Mycobacteroides abscessus subsp. a